MANGGDNPQDGDICGICRTRKDIDGKCPNMCQEYLNKSKVPATPSKLNQGYSKEQTEEEGRNEKKAISSEPAVSVEGLRFEYPSTDCYLPRLSHMLTSSTPLGIQASLSNPNRPPLTANPQQTTANSRDLPECVTPLRNGFRGPRWLTAISQVDRATDYSNSRPREKKRGIPGGVVVIYLTMQLCLKDSSLSDLPLTEHNIQAFQLLFNINKLECPTMRNNKFFFYNTDNRNHHQIREIIDKLKYQVKDICYRMFAGEIINGKTIETENDIVCFFELTGYHITQSQITGQIPSVLWSIEF